MPSGGSIQFISFPRVADEYLEPMLAQGPHLLLVITQRVLGMLI